MLVYSMWSANPECMVEISERVFDYMGPTLKHPLGGVFVASFRSHEAMACGTSTPSEPHSRLASLDPALIFRG